MACYCGFETTANKVKWTCLLVALVSGLTLYLAGVHEIFKTDVNYVDCMSRYRREGKISDDDYNKYYNHFEPERGCPMGGTPNKYINKCENAMIGDMMTMGELLNGGFLLLILATIPACIMCCCSRPPPAPVHGVPYAVAGTTAHEVVDVAPSSEDAGVKEPLVAPPVHHGALQ